jgi:hypothetical protein
MADVDWAAELLGPAAGLKTNVSDPSQAGTDWGAELLGSSAAASPVTPATPAPGPARVDPNAEPDAPSWLGRRVQDVVGKRDPRYKDVPTMAEVMNRDGSMTFGNAARESGAWLTGASDKDMAGVYRGMLGDRFVRQETDANGYPIIVYRGPDGGEARAYVNKPGLDMQDVVRGVEGLAPYVGAGRAVGALTKGASVVPRMVAQALGQGATSVAQDAAGVGAGVSDLDLAKTAGKAGLAAAGGAAGEAAGQALGYAWRKLVTEPRYFDRATRQLTPAGEDAARAAGLDPETLPQNIAQDFGREMAKTADPFEAASPVIRNEFRIPQTRGEMTGNMQDLLREQQMSAGTYGETAARIMKSFRDAQTKSIDNAVRGDMGPVEPGIAGKLAPDRIGASLGKDDLGANIRANTQSALDAAKKTESEAWKAVPDDFRATDEALAAIDDVIPQVLAARKVQVIEEGLTPAAKKMSDMIEKFQAGEMPKGSSRYVDKSLAGHVDVMRRRLLAGMQEAATPTDKRAAEALYDGFNDWIVEAAKHSGDPSIAMKLVTARSISREIHQAFDGEKGSAGARIMANILKKADSAEGVVNALFSAPSSGQIKGGAVAALDSLKRAYDTYLPREAAKAAWDDVRLAYWMRIAEKKTGDVGGPQALATSIKTALNSQGSIAKKLFTPEELGEMNRLAMVLESVARRNPNTSWSGVSMGALLRDIGNAVLNIVGWNNTLVRTVAGPALKPFTEAYGRQSAGKATGWGAGAGGRRAAPLPLAGPSGGVARENF